MKINNAFVQGGTGGPRKLCDICGVYFQWIRKMFRCPNCGAGADSEDIINSTRKILKADVSEPLIAHKQEKKKDPLAPDLPKGAQLIRDDQY